MVDLSIIIVNWNTRDLLTQCLESIFKRVRRVDLEVLVVDNGSTDGSGKEAKKAVPSVCLIESKKNLGFAKAANQGILKTSGKYVLLLNPDTQVKDGAIERFFRISRMEFVCCR